MSFPIDTMNAQSFAPRFQVEEAFKWHGQLYVMSADFCSDWEKTATRTSEVTEPHQALLHLEPRGEALRVHRIEREEDGRTRRWLC